MTALAAAGMTQVVETELLTAGLVDSIKVLCCALCYKHMFST